MMRDGIGRLTKSSPAAAAASCFDQQYGADDADGDMKVEGADARSRGQAMSSGGKSSPTLEDLRNVSQTLPPYLLSWLLDYT